MQGHEEKIRSCIVELELQIGSLWVSLLLTESTKHCIKIQRALDDLMMESAVKKTELLQVADQFASIIGFN